MLTAELTNGQNSEMQTGMAWLRAGGQSSLQARTTSPPTHKGGMDFKKSQSAELIFGDLLVFCLKA